MRTAGRRIQACSTSAKRFRSAAGGERISSGIVRETYARNSITGPGTANVDLALGKTFEVYGERLKGTFRVESFNLFNRTNFTRVNTAIRQPTFGQVIASASPRILQLALRFSL